jgi:hypothetical protein
MKKLIAFSSVLALVLAGSNLFAFDILNSEGEKSGFSLSVDARFGVAIDTPAPDAKTDYDPEPTTISQNNGDPHAKVAIGVGYDGDLYAFGLEAKGEKDFVGNTQALNVGDAWGKFYFMDKQLWLRGGTLANEWRLDVDPVKRSWGGANPGFQLNFSPSAVSGLSVGLSLPVPKSGARTFGENPDDKKLNWGPSYPFANMVFGLKLNGTIPNLEFGTELKLNGTEATNGKEGKDEAEGDFKGMDFHFTAKYALSPITITAAMAAEGIADGTKNPDNVRLTAGVRVGFAIPEVAPNLSLGSPWVQLVMDPSKLGNTEGKTDSFKDMHITFEWEPSYKIVPDKVTAKVWFQVKYSSWADLETGEEDYPLGFAVKPSVVFNFTPNASITLFDEVTAVQQKRDDGFKNQLGLRFYWGF